MRRMMFAAFLAVAGIAFAGCGGKDNVTSPSTDNALHAPLPGVCPCVPCGDGSQTQAAPIASKPQ
jgi:hypothetical protein